MSKVTEVLNWRFAVKQFDPSKKLSESQLKDMTEAMRLSPSSFGLQPWKFLVISDPEVKKKLRGASWNQAQVEDCSHLVVLCGVKNITNEDVDQFINFTAETRDQDPANLKGYADVVKGFLAGMDEPKIQGWSKNQVYIALGTLMTAAAYEGIDTCPIEGFEPEKYDDVLGLGDKGLKSMVVCALGVRSEDDKYGKLAKIRYPESQVVEYIK